MRDNEDRFKKAIAYLTLTKGTAAATGMGGFISPRHVLTAKHVIDGCQNIFITNIYGERAFYKLGENILGVHTHHASDLAILALDQDLAPVHFSLPAPSYALWNTQDAYILSDKGKFFGVDLEPTEKPAQPGFLKRLFNSKTPAPERGFAAPADPVIRAIDFKKASMPQPITQDNYQSDRKFNGLEWVINLKTSFAIKKGQSGSVIFDAQGTALSVLAGASASDIRKAVNDHEKRRAQYKLEGRPEPDNRVVPFVATYTRHLGELARDAGLIPPTPES